MRKILITGGAGFIPSSLADELCKDSSNEIVLVDNFETGFKYNLTCLDKPNCKFIKADVNNYNDISAVIFSNNFDYIFHYAAYVGVKKTLENPVKVLDDIKGLETIVQLAKNTNVKRVFYSSSSEVYGEPVEFPQNENTTPLNSKLPYAVVKNLGEVYLKAYHQEYGLNYTIFRFFNTYGPKQSEDFVISKFLNAALKNEPITIYGDGSQTRTFCFIEDNLKATLACLNQELHMNDIVNIGSDIEIPIKKLAEIVIKQTNSKSEIVHLPPLKEGDMTRRYPDVSKMKDLIKKDFTPIEQGIQKVIEYKKKFYGNA
ncbi:MAG: NAD-dependent epimerase/dehydratase family protein [Cytophagaceae bacterium]